MAEYATGILKRSGGGALLVNAVAPAQGAVRVPARLVQQFALVEGATVGGNVRQGRQGRELATVETVCGLTPEAYHKRPRFSDLIALDPSERFKLGATGGAGMWQRGGGAAGQSDALDPCVQSKGQQHAPHPVWRY